MIRAYRKSYKSQLIKLLRLNTPSYFHPQEEEDFSMYLDEDAEHYFVYIYEKEIIGCGGINYGFDNGATARLSWDMVHPHFHGMGIGSQLVEHRLSQIKANSEVTNVVVRTTQMAYRYYLKFGFINVKIEKDYWQEGFDLYYLVKQL